MNYSTENIENHRLSHAWDSLRRALVTFTMLFVTICSFSQTEPRIISSVDSTSIRIGEQINFRVEVLADTTSHVIFPEGQTFAPLEMVESSPVDTVIELDKLNLIKKYALTQFDSGAYTLPPQKIMINDRVFYTDSLKIMVNSVEVDTLKQKMYDIKPMVEVQKSNSDWWKTALFILIGLAGIAAIIYWFFFRKKPLSEQEQIALLPPYDRALLELKKLDESKFLIQAEYKEYYSELTNIVRSYLEEDVHITALESTTDELISKLEMLKDAGSLKIDEESIKQFQKVLQTADLVKFARSVPDNSIIESDRKTVELLVVKTKEALPEPTEEELHEKQEYKEEQSRKQRRRRIVLAAASILAFIITYPMIAFGPRYVFDTITGNHNKSLLEGEWISSDYGFPSLHLETPQVLKRTQTPIAGDMGAKVISNQTFSLGNVYDPYYVAAAVTLFHPEEKLDGQKAIDAAISTLEAEGAKNLIVKQDDFSTLTGKKGVKVYGTLELSDPKTDKSKKSDYILLNFVQNGGFQQILIVHRTDDSYADEITERIINSIDFKTAG